MMVEGGYLLENELKYERPVNEHCRFMILLAKHGDLLEGDMDYNSGVRFRVVRGKAQEGTVAREDDGCGL